MITNEDEARAFVSDLCDSESMGRLARFGELLIQENKRQNLVSRATLSAIWLRHIADSAQLLAYGKDAKGPWLDLGSGAGFPGLVVAIMRPKLPVILVESRKRRIEWLDRTIADIGLENCQVYGDRLEKIGGFPASTISARAFAPLDRLLNLSARFSTSTTHWVLPKGRSAAQEVRDLPKKARNMFHVEQSRTDHEAGIIVGRGQWSAKL